MFFEDEWFMKMAIEQAEMASTLSEVPVGAVLVDQSGAVLAKAHNLKEKVHNPCGHAEIETIIAACNELGDWRLENTTLYVTLEPCAMCAGAILHARVARVVFGAYDPKGGVLSCGMNVFGNSKLNHNVEIVGGVQHYECAKQLSVFFKQRRSGHK